MVRILRWCWFIFDWIGLVWIRLQDDFRAFRRQLDDKRPLIEQSILTGRQLVTNEAALSDASDSEGNFASHSNRYLCLLQGKLNEIIKRDNEPYRTNKCENRPRLQERAERAVAHNCAFKLWIFQQFDPSTLVGRLLMPIRVWNPDPISSRRDEFTNPTTINKFLARSVRFAKYSINTYIGFILSFQLYQCFYLIIFNWWLWRFICS